MLSTLFLLACARAPVAPDVGLPPEPGHLTILHTNDLHGHFLPEPAEWLDGRPAIGGMVRLEQEVRSLRAQRPQGSVLLLDGGDLLTGTPLTDMELDGAKGGAMMKLLGRVGYDLWVVGNHEFDKGLDNLAALTRISPIPVLSANLRAPGGQRPLLPHQKSSEIVRVGDLRVAVIGATTDALARLMNARDFSRLELLKVEAAVRAEVQRLAPKVDVVVVLSHIGLDADRALARAVPGIDVIVGAHSHTRLTHAEVVEDTWIVQAGSYGRSLGVVDLDVSGGRVGGVRYQLRDLLPADAPLPPDPGLVAMVDGWKREMDGYYGHRVTTASALLGRSYHHESALGDWITDALREAAESDVAFYNGGGLRADLPAGEVTRGSLYACFPFNNEVKRFGIRGDALRGVLLRNAMAELDEKRGFVSVSGVTYRWRTVNGAAEVVDAWVGGKPLDPARLYTAATTSYIAEQWEKHLGAEPVELVTLPMTDFDAALAHASGGPLRAPSDARAVRVD
jgi:5'-nucleotidase